MKKIVLKSVFDAFEYVMDHYSPYGLEDMRSRSDTYAVISIQDAQSGGFGFEFCKNPFCKDVLTLRFDDTVEEVDGAVLFNEQMARAIISFIEKNRKADTLLLHCYAGQSRSRAVAAFAVKMFGKDNSVYFEKGNPNMHVYRLLEDTWMKMRKERADGQKDLGDQIREYNPYNDQEEKDKEILLQLLESGKDIFTRNNETCHLTASAWVCDPAKEHVLMAYHRIYDSWAWLGGHADGETDLLRTALREVREESGLKNVRAVSPKIFSLEILPVNGHIKKGNYVASHLHLNLTFLLEADPEEELTAKEDENSGVAWFTLDEAVEASTEPWFKENIYKKLNQKLKQLEQTVTELAG